MDAFVSVVTEHDPGLANWLELDRRTVRETAVAVLNQDL